MENLKLSGRVGKTVQTSPKVALRPVYFSTSFYHSLKACGDHLPGESGSAEGASREGGMSDRLNTQSLGDVTKEKRKRVTT